MSGDTTSDEEGSQEDSPRYDVDDLEIIKTIGTGTFGRVVLCRHQGTPLALKILSMVDVIRLKQVEHVRNEITVLKEVNHPFIVNMLWSGRDEARVYMLLEFVAGGELFSYLRAAGRFSGPTSCFYAAEIVCALEYLHSKHIVYRDLKPENLLLDSQGHLKITDFGFSKKLTDRYGHFITYPYAMESYEEDELAELLKANHWTIADFLKIVEPCEDIFEACWWSSEKIDCGKSLVLSHSSYGFCCSFNYLLEEFVGRDKNQPTPKPIRSVDYGRRSGLKVLINRRILNTDAVTNQSFQSAKSISNNDGIAVLIHHSLDFPGLNTDLYILQKNDELQIHVNPTVSGASKDLYQRSREGKVVPLCVRNADALEYFPVYTYANCYANCRVKAMIKICGCLPFIYEHLVAYHHITPCEIEGLTCIQKNAKQISIIRDVQQPNLTCSCQTPCEEVVYTGLPVTVDLTHSQAATSYKNVTSGDAILRVFMLSQVFVTMETVSAADEVYLLASIGGIFSLFLGCSFLSVVEILYYVKLFCHAVYLRRKKESSAKSYEDYGDTRRSIY
ncbi:uncharacterized protein LOC143209657 isoform X1 [Lasioglossum baleicum]|uniref:uncharacterized protein LOC143209657 isoform X1 n=1 Tax=Lasioglossum baleicum TaxID=434251 RepID=UPI003FCDEFFD